jgi:hypothetical protein
MASAVSIMLHPPDGEGWGGGDTLEPQHHGDRTLLSLHLNVVVYQKRKVFHRLCRKFCSGGYEGAVALGSGHL